MAEKIYKVAVGGIIAIIVFGGVMAYNGYNADIYPIDRMRGNMDGIMATSDPDAIQSHLAEIKKDMTVILANDFIPEQRDANGVLVSKNPVWVFSTTTTNLVRIDANIDTMILRVEKIATSPMDSSAFNTGMSDLHIKAQTLKSNLGEVTPFMYISVSNIIFSIIWITSIILIFSVVKKKREKLKDQESLEGGV